MTPRVLRIASAAEYLGLSRAYFDQNIRKQLKERKWLGVTFFDRIEIDDFITQNNIAEDQKKSENKKGNLRIIQKGKKTCPHKSKVYTKEVNSGISTNTTEGNAFAEVFAQITDKKPKPSSYK